MMEKIENGELELFWLNHSRCANHEVALLRSSAFLAREPRFPLATWTAKRETIF